eukprot:1148732-Pelagomonas_calceolata.AAC.4
MGLPASVHALQRSKKLGIRCSNDTSKPSVNQHNILPETLQTCPQTEEITATRPVEPDSEPPKKRKRSRHGTSITPPVHLTHHLLLSTIQSNTLFPPDVNPEARNNLNTLPRDTPSIRANLPGLQIELPEGGPPSKRTRFTKRHDSRFMPQQCSQGISGSSANYYDEDCIYTEPDHFYTAATSQYGTLSILLTHPNKRKEKKKKKSLRSLEA